MSYLPFILEPLTEKNLPMVRAIDRQDVSEDFVDSIDTLAALTRYGNEHHCLGHTFAVRQESVYIGVILIGEAIPWETDPPEMRQAPFYRLMGFVLDRRWRGRGLGGMVLEEAIARCYQDFGVRPIVLGCHKDNLDAERFYLRHGFVKTEAMEENDYYYFRYPSQQANALI